MLEANGIDPRFTATDVMMNFEALAMSVGFELLSEADNSILED